MTPKYFTCLTQIDRTLYLAKDYIHFSFITCRIIFLSWLLS